MKENEIYRDDEIDLVELFATLWNGKIKIIVITVVFLVVGILYTLIATSWYKASALVEVGYYNINENGVIKSIMLEEPKNIIEKLKTRYIDLLKDVEGKDVDVKSVNEIKNNNKFFSIEVIGKSNEKAVKMIDEMIQSVSDEHKKIIDGYISSQKVKLANIEDQIKVLQNDKMGETENQINNVEQNLQMQKAGALNDILSALQKELKELTYIQKIELKNTLLGQKSVIEFTLKPSNYKNTSIVSQIITSKHPEKPKKFIILAVALLAGAMIGVFWVLFTDFMKKRKELEMPEKTETSSQEVEQILQNLIDKRAEFYKFLDENIEKIPNCDAYDFKDDEKMKKLYEKFFAFDYKVRKILPFIYKVYGVKLDV